MKTQLIESISKQLNIPLTGTESLCRIVYSVAGKMALASLWDYDEEHNSVSVQHFKDRVAEIADAYTDLYPEIGNCFSDNKTDLAEEIYSVYLHCGYFYHSANRIAPSAPAESSCEGIRLMRGVSPDAKLFMSGLGFYDNCYQPESERTTANVFSLQEKSFENYLEELLGSGPLESVTWPDSTEFLRLDPPFTRGYWQQTPNTDGRVSIARFGNPNKIYMLFRYDNEMFRQKPIPEWCLKDHFSNETNYGEYRRIATALLHRYQTLPPIKVKEAEDTIEIKVGYRLPPSEERFFMLYSWPVVFDFTRDYSQVFTRKMAKQFYPAFKRELSSIGYRFAEE